MDITNVIFNLPDNDGNIVGNIFFQNGYGINLLQLSGDTNYNLNFIIQDLTNLWRAEMDDNLLTISSTNDLEELTTEQVNEFILQVSNLPNS